MHTEEDLRATFGALEHEAPDPVGTLAGFERLRHRRKVRRRAAGAVAAAAVTVAVAAASIAISTFVDTPDQAPVAQPGSSQSAVDTSSTQVIPGISAGRISVQAAPGSDEPVILRVEVHQGGYDSTVAKGGEPVQLDGKSGFYAANLPCRACEGGQYPTPGVAWEHEPGTWVVLLWGAPSPPADVKDRLVRTASEIVAGS